MSFVRAVALEEGNSNPRGWEERMLMADQDDEGAAGLGSVSAPIGGEAATLPTIVPEGGGAPSGGRRPRWMVPVVVAVVVVVAGLVGWRVVENRRHGAALDSCSRAVKALQGKTGPDRLAQYREVAGIKTDQVKDAETVVAMARSVKDAEGLRQPTVRCKASMSTDKLNAEAGRAKKLDGEYAAVARAAKAVTASRDAKALKDARAALDGKKGEASRLLADSGGKVTDAAVRDGLQQAIGQASQIKSGKAKACQDATAALQAAIDRVNASVQAKSQADQQSAQAQAAQQQAQQQGATQRRQASSNSGRRGSTQSSSRPSGNRGGGGGGSAPAPAPAAPQGGNSNWRDRLNNDPPTNGGKPVCQKGQACGIG